MKKAFLAIASLLLLLLVLILCFPLLLRTQYAKNQLETTLGDALQATVIIDAVSFSWSEGLRMADLSVQPGPEGPLELGLGSLSLDVDWSELFTGTVDFRAAIRSVDAVIVLPVAENESDLDSPADEAMVLPDLATYLRVPDIPGWLRGNAAIQGVSVRIRRDGQELAVEDIQASVLLDGTQGEAELKLAARALGEAIALAASLRQDSLSMTATAPGFDCNVRTAGTTLSGNMRADIARCLDLAAPFVPSSVPDITGEVRGTVLVEPDEGLLNAAVQFGLRHLHMQGGALPSPVKIPELSLSSNVHVKANGDMDLREGKATMPGLDVSFSADMNRQPDGMRWKASVNKAEADLPVLLSMVRGFLPQWVGLDSGALSLGRIVASGNVDGLHHIEANDFDLDLAGVAGPQGFGMATAVISIKDTEVVLNGEFPVVRKMEGTGAVTGAVLPELDRPGNASIAFDVVEARMDGDDFFVDQLTIDGTALSRAVGFTFKAHVGNDFTLTGNVVTDMEGVISHVRLPLDGGRISVDISASGRLPVATDTQALEADSLLEKTAGLNFLKSLHVATALDGVRIGSEDKPLVNVTTKRPIVLDLTNGVKDLALDGSMAVLSRLLPAPMTLDMKVALARLDALEWTMSGRLEQMGLSLSSKGRVGGGRRAAQAVLEEQADPVLTVLKWVSADWNNSLTMQGGRLKNNGTTVSGNATVTFAGTLDPDSSIEASVHAVMNDLGITTSQGGVSGLSGTMDMTRSLALVDRRPTAVRTGGLSRTVLDPGSMHDLLSGPGRDNGSIVFDSARYAGPPFPLDFRNGEIAVAIGEQLGLQGFGFDLLGGSVRGQALLREGNAPKMALEAVCTGIDFASLLQTPDMGRDAAVDARVNMSVPIDPDAGNLLEGIELTALVPRIGSATLDSMLAAMDPDGADPNIAAQRRMVSMGGPRNIELRIRGGNLSLDGEVEVLGLRLNLPPVRRVSLAALPVRAMLEPMAGALGTVGRFVQLWRADALLLTKTGPMPLHGQHDISRKP